MKATLYIWKSCPFCIRALQTLDEHGVEYEAHAMEGRDAELQELKQKYGHWSVPIILLDEKFIGGNDELTELARAGGLS